MQRPSRGWYDNVHVPGTFGAGRIWSERLKTHTASGHLRVWDGDLPGTPEEPQGICCFDTHVLQVLTGEIPLAWVQDTAMGYHVLRGTRPEKPWNASAIGFSDSLWNFTQRCWDGKMELRPRVGEVVMHLGEVAANWDGLMPPCAQAQNDASYSEEETSDSEFGEFNTLTLPLYCRPSDGTDGLFLSPSSGFPESPIESETGFKLFNRPITPPVQRDGRSQQGSREATTELFGQLKT